jgi:hypothetical protein
VSTKAVRSSPAALSLNISEAPGRKVAISHNVWMKVPGESTLAAHHSHGTTTVDHLC